MSAAELHTLAGAYVLHALPSDEVRFFESHLAACDSCREEVIELQATTATLSAVVAEPAPSRLRENVMAAVEVTRQLPTVPLEVGEAARDRRPISRLLAVAAGLLLVTAIALGGVVAQLNGRVNELQAEVAQTYDVLAAPDATTVALTGQGDARARMVMSPRQERAVLVASGLPALAEDRTYQLWLISDGDPQGAGLLQPGPDGRAVERMEAADLADVAQVAITVEPAGGSAQPTADPILAGQP